MQQISQPQLALKKATKNASVDKQLTSRQLAYFDILSDGNCLFRSVAMCLYGYQLKHAQLRAAVVLLMKSRVEAECQLPGDAAAAKRRIDEIATEGNRVGEGVILAMADYLQRKICVFFASDMASPLKYSPTASNTSGVINDPIHMAFYELGHFRAEERKIFSKPLASLAKMDVTHLNSSTTCRLSKNYISSATCDH